MKSNALVLTRIVKSTAFVVNVLLIIVKTRARQCV